MTLKLLVIEPVEPLALSRTPISGPEHLGARATVFHIPQPTTVLGAIGAALEVHVSYGLDVGRLEDVKAVATKVSERLSCGEPMLIGPLLASKDLTELYVPVGRDLYASVRLIEKVLRLEHRIPHLDLGPCYESPGACVEPSIHSRVGIALERRGEVGEKVVKLGHMYRYSVVVYRDTSTEVPTPHSSVYALNCNGDLDSVVRVGGEGRVARLYTEARVPQALDKLANPATRLEPGVYLSVGYIPIVPKSQRVLGLKLEEFHGLEFLEEESDVMGLPQVGGAPPKVRIERLGLGFSESQGTRRPQLLALPPATLLRVGKARKSISSVDTIMTLWKIGYSSMYKLPAVYAADYRREDRKVDVSRGEAVT
ncbi:MAG: type III-B CRISPR module-associated Cmr3 family protein [Sulfolobales archaeon]